MGGRFLDPSQAGMFIRGKQIYFYVKGIRFYLHCDQRLRFEAHGISSCCPPRVPVGTKCKVCQSTVKNDFCVVLPKKSRFAYSKTYPKSFKDYFFHVGCFYDQFQNLKDHDSQSDNDSLLRELVENIKSTISRIEKDPELMKTVFAEKA